MRNGKTIIAIFIILVLTLIVYWNSLYAEFQFDDQNFLVAFSSMGGDSGQDAFLDVVGSYGLTGRPIVGATFALNYSLGGNDPRWFHITNFLIHCVNGLLVFYLALATLRSPALSRHENELAPTVALLSTALFMLHPIQTQAVTYISQRYETMGSMFYLCSMLAFIKAGKSRGMIGRSFFYSMSALGFFLGLGSKEIIVTLPIMVIFCDYFFLRERPFVKRFMFPGALIVISVFAGVSLLLRHEGPRSVGFGVGGITPWEYLLTQFRAIVLYFRLLFLPINQNLDYAFEPSRSIFEFKTALSFLFLLAVITAAIALRKKWKVASFFSMWFFIILAPTSSLFPIVDPVFEHRVYLASAGIFIMAAYGFSRGLTLPAPSKRTLSYAALAIIVIALAIATYERNKVWTSAVTLWEDVAIKSPYKARVHYNLANAYQRRGMITEAIEHYEVSVRLDPKKSNAFNNLANSYIMLGRYNEALEVYKKAIEADEKNYQAYYNLGVTLKRMGKREESAFYLKMFVNNAPNMLSAQKELAKRMLKEMR